MPPAAIDLIFCEECVQPLSTSITRTMADKQPAIRLQLLGLPCIARDAEAAPLGAGRPVQLLGYLAVRGLWQSRDEVAKLFWPDRTKKIARSNLRNLLCKTVAAAPYAPIESTEHALRLNAPSDLNDFEAAVERGDSEFAVQIGAAELLQGFETHASEPYLLWLQAARLVQLTQWTKSVQVLLAQTSRPIEQRAALAEAWALHCPYDEDAVRAQVNIALEHHQAGAAATLFRAFDARLQQEFGVRASRALEQLALESAPTSAPALALRGGTAAPHSTPEDSFGSERARLFGRRLELGQVKALLADSTVRLLTLTGPGGVGKSTLITAVFDQCAAEADLGACLIDASAAANAQAVIAAIAAALGIDGLQGADNGEALAATLRDRRCLLMIDGAEQPDLRAPLALLLDRCPQTRLVIASRGRLHLDQERVLVLDGFPLPDTDETDAAVLGSNDAVRYFIDVMAQAGQPINLANDASTLAALVHAVGGLPLALKLLAKLTRVFSLTQLLASVQAHVAGARAAGSPELGELMPALVASFEHSWTALSPAERAVLARLAVFPAAFDVAAARAIAHTQLPIITSLIDRSLVRADGAGRLSLHAGIRACVLAACPLSDDALAAYVEFYSQRLAALAKLAKVKTVRPLQHFLREDAKHIEHAWRTALRLRAYPALLLYAQWLSHQATIFGGADDYLAWFVEAERLLGDDPCAPDALMAFVLVGAANASRFHGKPDLALSQCNAALRAARRTRHRDAICAALEALGMSQVTRGKMKDAERAIARLAAMNNEDFRGNLIDLRSMFSSVNADHKTALRLLDELIAIDLQLEDANSVVSSLVNKWLVHVASGDFPKASEAIEKACAAAAASDVRRHLEASTMAFAAQWYVDIGDWAKAESCIERANAIALISPGTRVLYLKSELITGAIAVVSGDPMRAVPPLTKVLDEIGRGELPNMANAAFLYAAKWFVLASDRNACVSLLRVIRGGAFSRIYADAAQLMLRELGEEPQPETVPEVHPDTIAELARDARRRMLSLAEEMQRSNRMQE